MNKRVPYTIIPKYLKTINDLDNGSNIKVVYWNRSVKKPLFRRLPNLIAETVDI